MQSVRALVSALATMILVTSPAWAETVDFHAVAGLPRTGIGANGQVAAWRNLGIRAESEWLDAEITLPTCLSPAQTPFARDDATLRSCAAPGAPSSMGGDNHQASVTLKLPHWDEHLPWVDVSVQHWRAALVGGSGPTRRSGATGAMLLTQPFGEVDAIGGFEVPLNWSTDSSGWRTVYMGFAWRSAAGYTFEMIGERGVERTSGVTDRLLTLRLARRFNASGARVAGWSTRSFGDAPNAWRIGLGLEVPF